MKSILWRYTFVLNLCWINVSNAKQIEVVLNLKQFINKAISNDEEAQSINIQKDQIKFYKDLNMPSSALTIAVANEYGYSTSKSEARTSEFVSTLNKSFPTTGTDSSLSLRINDLEDRNEQTTTFKIQQSIYQNAFGYTMRKLSRNLDLENRITLMEVHKSFETYVKKIVLIYLDWHLAYINYKTQQNLYNDSKKLLNYVKKKQQKSIALKLEVDKHELQTLIQEEQLLNYKTQLETHQKLIKEIIGQANTNFRNSITFIPYKEKIFSDSNINFNYAKDQFFRKSNTMEIFRLKQQVVKDKLAIVKDTLRPDINLEFGYKNDESKRFKTTVGREEYLVGINISLPFWDNVNSALVEKTSYDQTILTLEKNLYIQNKVTYLDNLESIIFDQRRRVAIGNKKLNLARKINFLEKERYQLGKIDFETYLVSENTMIENQFSFVADKVKLDKYIVEWLEAVGQLALKLNISI